MSTGTVADLCDPAGKAGTVAAAVSSSLAAALAIAACVIRKPKTAALALGIVALLVAVTAAGIIIAVGLARRSRSKERASQLRRSTKVCANSVPLLTSAECPSAARTLAVVAERHGDAIGSAQDSHGAATPAKGTRPAGANAAANNGAYTTSSHEPGEQSAASVRMHASKREAALTKGRKSSRRVSHKARVYFSPVVHEEQTFVRDEPPLAVGVARGARGHPVLSLAPEPTEPRTSNLRSSDSQPPPRQHLVAYHSVDVGGGHEQTSGRSQLLSHESETAVDAGAGHGSLDARLDDLRVPVTRSNPPAQAALSPSDIPSEPATFVDEQAPSAEAAYWEQVRQQTEGRPGFLASEAGSAISEPPGARHATAPPQPPRLLPARSVPNLAGPSVHSLQPADASSDPVQRIMDARSRHIAMRFTGERLHRALAHQRQVNRDLQTSESTGREGTTRKITLKEYEAFKRAQAQGPKRGGHDVSAHA
jgi:hypothetical protein